MKLPFRKVQIFRQSTVMKKQIIFDENSDGDEHPMEDTNNEIDDDDEQLLSSDKEESENDQNEEKPTNQASAYDDDSDDDSDAAPEEVSVSSSKAHTMEMQEAQKQAALATKRRRRKQRYEVSNEGLDEDTLKLLSENTVSLSADTTTASEETKPNIHITLTHEGYDSTQKVEKNVDGFKLVSLAKDRSASIGKPINRAILDFQRSHFYGKGTKRVDCKSFISREKVTKVQKK